MPIFNSCRLDCQRPRWFVVGGGCACLLKVAGLAEDQSIPLLMWVGDSAKKIGDWVPAIDLQGNSFVLTKENCLLLVKTPGCYKIDVSSIPLSTGIEDTETTCITVGKEEVDGDELVLIDPPENPHVDVIELLKNTVTFIPGAYEQDTGNCYPMGTRPRCDGSAAVDCVYFDPEKKEYIMSTGNAGQNSPEKAEAACLFTCAVKEICAADADTTLTSAQIKDELLSQGATYHDGTTVAATDALTGFAIELLHLNDQVTKDDGTTYVTQTCDASITGADDATPIDIEPGGAEPAGHDFENVGHVKPEWVTDMTGGEVAIKAGSAIRVRGFFGRCGPEGTVQPLDPNAPEAVGPVKDAAKEG